MSKKVVLHVYRGGGFPRMPHLLNSEGDISEFECDAEKLSVDNIRDNIVPLGYSKRNIKAIYLSKPNLGFEESLVAINSDIEVNELCLLSSILEYVCLYVKHNNETKSDSDDSDAMVDDDLNEYGFERGMRRISSDWLARTYREKFRLQPNLRLKELQDIMEKKQNYKPLMSTCVKTRVKALASILGDYSQ
ncbi:hypothetical protein Cgig2_011133 [Carnegiea gigantea]|uniref:Uncharacterized protein n=1 Tax=Carnegiea gigantea TaxID=171969 RepID=A0A9Q1GK55_9CARY|nr:hypothetical protein Cgig2_011133 [Carnegiea gigantea]